MSSYIHCLILVEPESSLHSKEPKKGKKTSRSARKKYALLPAKSVKHPFAKILTQNGIKLIKNGQVTPPISLKLKVLQLFLDDNLSDGHDEPIRVYVDFSTQNSVQPLLSKSTALFQICIDSYSSFFRALFPTEEEANLNALEKLLVAKVDMTPLDPNAGSFLHIAAVDLHFRDLIQLLLKHGANVNSIRKDGATPLHIAASLSDLNNVKILLENGACLNVKMQDGSTPLHEAAKAGSLCVVSCLLDRRAEVNAESEDGSTPLHKATKKGSLEIVRLLVQKGAQVGAKTEDGVTSLHVAAGLGMGSKFIPIVGLLLLNGADIHATDAKGDTPLHYSVKMLPDAMKLLVQSGADINVENKDSTTALLTAVSRGWTESYEYLLSLNPDVNTEGNRRAFLEALRKDGEKYRILVEQMIQKGYSVVVEDASNPEFLFGAIHKRRVEIVRSLLEYGANVNEYRRFLSLKVAPLHYAIRTNQPDVVQLLLDYGAVVNLQRGPLRHERTPITDAVEFASMEVMKMLLAKGVKARDEPSLLHLAAKNTDPKVAQFLLEERFHWNSRNQKGETPSSIAVSSGNLQVINVMVYFGAQVDLSYLPNRYAGMFEDSAVFEKFLRFCFTRPSPAAETIISELLRHNFGYGSPDHCCTKTLAKHLIKLKVANEAVCARDLIPNHLLEKFSLSDFQRQCELETESLKLKKVGCTDVSLFDVLTKNFNQIACFARNQNFCESSEVYDSSNHPIYGSVVFLNFRSGCIRRQLLNIGIKVLSLFCQHFLALPLDLKEIVIDYLSNQDLLILRKCLSTQSSN